MNLNIHPGICITSLFLYLFCAGFLSAQPSISLSSFATGFSKPVDIAHAGDSRMFVVEQKGNIFIVNADGSVNSDAFLNIQNIVGSNGNERGLLGLAFHPDYATNGYFFVNYTNGSGNSTVARYTVDPQNPDLADPNSDEIILTLVQPFTNHNGGDLNFGPDGYLYLGFGDGGSGNDPQNNGQNTSTFHGKILRIDVDNGLPYSIPPDNPFINDANVLDEIWSLGWRNPWRFSFDRLTGDMWVADVGQMLYEEVSFEDSATGGLNYGWRCLEGDNIFNPNGCASVDNYVAPIFDYSHSFNRGSCITGGFVYRGQNYPSLQGHYVFGDFNSGQFWTLYSNTNGGFDTTQQGKLLGRDRLSTFGEGANGEIYVASHIEGIIYKLTETTNGVFSGIDAMPLNIYPLPFKDQIKIEFDNPSAKPYRLRLMNTQGQILREIQDIRTASLFLQRENLPSGIYLLEIRGEKLFSGKVLVE